MAEFERDLIKERVKAGMELAKKKGVRIGRPKLNVDIERLKELRKDGFYFNHIIVTK